MTRRAGSALFWRLFAATASIVAVVLAPVLGVLSASASQATDAALARGLDASRRHVQALLDGRSLAVEGGALVFAESPAFRALVLARRPPDLLDQAVEAAQRTGATWVQITDAEGVRLAKSDEPAAPAATLAGTALVGAALGGTVSAGLGIAGDSALFQGVAVPVLVNTQVAGVLMAALTMDSALAHAIRDATASDVVIYLVDTAGTPRVSAATLPRAPALDALLAERAPALRVRDSAGTGRLALRLGDDDYVGQGLPLRSAGGEVLGGVLTLRSRDRELAPFLALRRRIVLAGAVGLALACVLSWALAQRVTAPIRALTAAARRGGDGPWRAALGADVGEDLGDLADAVGAVLSDARGRHTIAEFLADAEHGTRPVEEAPSDVAAGFRVAVAAGVGAEAVTHRLAAGLVTTEPRRDARFAPGRTVAGRYVIERVLGDGGGGVVYRARDLELGETVALKTLHADATHDPATLERFKDEIRLARRISHPNVVRIHDLGEADGAYFITMEHVVGTTLHAVLQRLGRLPPAVTVAVGRQLCRALEVAHAQGIVHRDVKPQNLMLQPDGALKVMDFGIARLTERPRGVTVTGAVVGTPAYMAPEQLMGEPLDARADVYAAGVVLYECLTGRRPFDAPSPAGYVAQLMSQEPVPPSTWEPRVSAALSDAVLRALARDAERRPRSAAALGELLERAGR